VIGGRETDLALREEALTTREREAEALRRQLQTILASLERTAVAVRPSVAWNHLAGLYIVGPFLDFLLSLCPGGSRFVGIRPFSGSELFCRPHTTRR
jgi:hypothetical protein